MATVLTKSARHLTPHTSHLTPHLTPSFSHTNCPLSASEFPELVWPVTGLIIGGVYLLLQKLSFISLGLKFPNNPVILGPGYFVSNEKSCFDKATRDKLWIILIADDSPLTIKKNSPLQRKSVSKKIEYSNQNL